MNEAIGRLAPDGAISEFPLPFVALPNGSGPYGITAGPDGALWFVEIRGNKVVRITTSGGIIEYPLPTPHGDPYRITPGPDGALWFTEMAAGKIGRITVAGTITEYALVPGSDPTDIVQGPDGALWFTNINNNWIGRITTQGVLTKYTIPVPCFDHGITSGPDGALWFACYSDTAGKIGRLSLSGVFSLYNTPTPSSGPTYITTGQDGALWFTESKSNKIGRITVDGAFAEYDAGSPGGQPVGLTIGPDGNLWFGRIGYIGKIVIVDSTPPMITPQISGTTGNNGWYRSNVTINWIVTDPETGIASSTGCGTTNLSTDSSGTEVKCSATNNAGLSNSASVTIKIDKAGPLISGMPVNGCDLWPPNHELKKVATVRASDLLSGVAAGSFSVTGVSNEPSDPRAPDIVITPDGSGGFDVQVRAERSGLGNGRIYSLTANATDQAGNTATVVATCTVAHDQRK